MGFSGIGIWEIVIIFVVILIILGPHRLPEIARSLGRAFRAIKKASADLSTNITKELEETKTQQSSTPTNQLTTNKPATNKPSPANQPDSPDKDDHPRKTGGAPAEK
jgi:Tat protein translocase TatB subunit